jgi:membrane protein implicated in regulation of membrane protease activity
MYLDRGEQITLVLLYSVLWGGVAMFGVAGIFYLLRRMTETGTPNIASCLGKTGSVYLDILPEGQGEARLIVSGAVSFVKARAVGDKGIKAGTPVRVVRVLGPTTVQVEPLGESSGDQISQGKEE